MSRSPRFIVYMWQEAASGSAKCGQRTVAANRAARSGHAATDSAHLNQNFAMRR
jgi:hypothetical protein